LEVKLACKIFVVDGEIKSHLYYRDDIVTVIDCITCHAPMMVPNRCSMVLSLVEANHILNVVDQLFGKNVKLRCLQRKIDQHYHLHIET